MKCGDPAIATGTATAATSAASTSTSFFMNLPSVTLSTPRESVSLFRHLLSTPFGRPRRSGVADLRRPLLGEALLLQPLVHLRTFNRGVFLARNLHPPPFTLFRRGFAFFALAEALRVEAASIAPARFLLPPCCLAIFDCTALKPGWAFFFAIRSSSQSLRQVNSVTW